MNFEKCPLYKLQRKRDLYLILHTNKNEIENYKYKYKVCIENGKRLLEKPGEPLKRLQRRILYSLYKINFPEYVFSGIKGKSAFDNAIYHINSRYMLKLDISKFFPNTHRNKVYVFFKEKLKMSSDIASIFTDLVTVNYNNKNVIINSDVKEFLYNKKIKTENHLPSGTPTSQILSYLANEDMFNEIISYTKTHKLKCSIYVDDITISSEKRKITKKEESEIKHIIKKYNHRISIDKIISYGKNEYKKITGFVISPENKLVIPNKIKSKIKDKSKFIRKVNSITVADKNTLIGLTNFANLSIKGKYDGLIKKIRNMQENLD